jgi:MoaA/NifB/PqqE/SkfB family radical SAM enzyme
MSTDVAESMPVSRRKQYVKTRKRVLSRRGVLWLGQTCNLRCYFCYFLNRIDDASHPEHPFMTLEKAKEICHTLRYYYGDTAIDIQGGEPTIHPEIHELISYCSEIGLHPTLITNGLALANIEKLEKRQAFAIFWSVCMASGIFTTKLYAARAPM